MYNICVNKIRPLFNSGESGEIRYYQTFKKRFKKILFLDYKFYIEYVKINKQKNKQNVGRKTYN